MKQPTVATIVNFCTNEWRFIKPCLEEALKFSKQVIVPVCDHFFDGTKENRKCLEQIYASFDRCLFVEYPFIPERIPKKVLKKVGPAQFWPSLSRLLAFQMLDDSIEKVLFLDADEVVDSARFSKWLETSPDIKIPILKLANYWYFREECYQSETLEDSAVLVQKDLLEPRILLRKEERDAVYDFLEGPKKRMVMMESEPMIHHYSWVRTEEEMLKKVRSWSHREDRDWESLVKKEFLEPFKGKDFIHGYSYKTVTPRFNLQKSPVFEKNGPSNVIRMGEKEVRSAIKKGYGSFWNLIFSFFA